MGTWLSLEMLCCGLIQRVPLSTLKYHCPLCDVGCSGFSLLGAECASAVFSQLPE